MKIKIEIEEMREREIDNMQYEKIADSGNKLDDGPVWRYVNAGTKIEGTKETIFKQEIEVESITHIIAAINGLEVPV